MSVTAIPARMVPHVKMQPTPIYVTALCQGWVWTPGVGETVTFNWLAANRINVNMKQAVSPC